MIVNFFLSAHSEPYLFYSIFSAKSTKKQRKKASLEVAQSVGLFFAMISLPHCRKVGSFRRLASLIE